ncbi:hypothetical protein BHU72_08055 [Desulfuribacillus stibiiarsenatis]|uniref:4-hydroxy-3-methylbut-2-enyl diphosphate reductase n=1 Tax=Desulfuribacillus stibiiarsenatis TaxID=1390249 RepID=A0A1E5L3T8_9FIRM|nr:bifunctional 4-hydroxy-3-methylbut-2-enyl diphosphate reductase/30S ribosomal protein S1 [Desulfuribacillus stibiiarsenatis]OEH84777.1 hypothetical protein BHU72_08055 [Desulfuribacillus stibiiarsenatis]
MTITLARHAGFCKGVQRAIDTAKKVGENHGKAVTLGPIVHNQHVVDYLYQYGVQTIDSIQEVKPDEAVVLRSHGVGKLVYDNLQENNISYIDATCPFVKAVHKLASKAYKENKTVLIVGDPKHPEVEGILGWTEDKGYVIKSIDDIENLPAINGDIVVVAQTTQTGENWNQITDCLKNKYTNIEFFNTICKATSERQEAAIDLAKQVDVMIVVGSFKSSNTNKLTQVCNLQGTKTYQIESKSDLNKDWLIGNHSIGITAGASTPDWILKEVIEMVEEMQNEMIDVKAMNQGDIVKGVVTNVEDNQVTVDIGYKYDAIIPIGELSNLHIEKASDFVKVGDQFELEVLRINDDKEKVVVSKKTIDAKLAWEDLKNKYENSTTFEVKVADVVKGGLVVDLGVRGFIPASHVERHFVEDFSEYKGKSIQVKIIEFDPENKKVILSQKMVLEAENNNLKSQAMSRVQIGSIIDGTVQRLTDFGAFVDIGGIDGLIHVSELAWYRVDHPSDVVKEGDKVQVKVLSIDSSKERISLSLKSAQAGPWDTISNQYKQGDIVDGVVKRLVSFGAFVELIQGVEGLVHISEISHDHIGSANEVLEVGQQVKVKILDYNVAEKRISLSIRQTTEDVKAKQEAEEIRKLTADQGPTTFTLGEMLGDKLKSLK